MPGMELLLTAVVGGAAAGLTATSSTAIGDAYAGLRGAVRRRLAARTGVPPQVGGGADREGRAASGDSPPEALGTAEPRSRPMAIDARGARGVQVGSRNVQSNHFH